MSKFSYSLLGFLAGIIITTSLFWTEWNKRVKLTSQDYVIQLYDWQEFQIKLLQEGNDKFGYFKGQPKDEIVYGVLCFGLGFQTGLSYQEILRLMKEDSI